MASMLDRPPGATNCLRVEYALGAWWQNLLLRLYSPQGCGVVEFETPEQAQDAIQLFNGTQVSQQPTRARRNPGRPSSSSVPVLPICRYAICTKGLHAAV